MMMSYYHLIWSYYYIILLLQVHDYDSAQTFFCDEEREVGGLYDDVTYKIHVYVNVKDYYGPGIFGRRGLFRLSLRGTYKCLPPMYVCVVV